LKFSGSAQTEKQQVKIANQFIKIHTAALRKISVVLT